jgi:1,4-alpha-glucan branching enzyme
VIYELWVYDYTPKRNLTGVQERLDYLQQLGVNAIELMPICEFDGNYNWGYSPNHYFAPDRAYGSETQIKTFIDECHKRGMAVIMDMVFNHATGLNPMNKLYPYGTDLSSNPWFCTQVPHDDNVYEKWNHDFAPARDMFTRALQYWIKEYKIDGYRMDLSHGMCGCGTKNSYNYEKLMNNISHYYTNAVLAAAKNSNGSYPNGEPYFILEHWGPKMNEQRPRLVQQGMLCWDNTNYAYTQVASGWLDQKDDISPANQDGYVTYAESHDEERMQYKAKTFGNGAIKTNEATRLARVPASVIMNVLLNGPHMLWQFEEIGYDFSINSDAGHPAGNNSDYRCNMKPRPESLGYFSNANRVAAYQKCAQAIQLRTRLHPEWFAGNPSNAVLGHAQKIRYVQWENVIAVANFDAAAAQSYSLPSGTWYNYLDGGTASGTVGLQAGEVKIFTKTQVALPQINLDLETLLPIENVQTNGKTAAQKILRDGQILILVGDKVYNLQGQRVR